MLKLRTAVSMIALLATADAWAQSAAPSAGQNSLEEVVVTAQRREQQLQRVPLAVSAFNAAEIERRQISSTLDVIRNVPNMIGNNNVGLGSSNTYYIRGIGNTESIATQDVPVGTYVDDVYISRQNANNFGLFDVERIEVLRGPQGTLFGRNTTGGAINVIMRKPSDHVTGYAEAAYGRYDRREFRGSIDMPVSDKILTKLSAYKIDADGYATQVSTGAKLNGEDSYGLRGAVSFLVSDRVTLDVTADLIDEDSANILNQVRPGTEKRIATTGIVQGSLTRFFTGDKRFNSPGNQTKSYSTTANLKWDLENFTLNSITGYRRTHQDYFIDSISLAPNPIPTGASPILNEGIHQQWSQELKASGKALNDRLDYVVGLYFLRENNKTDLGTASGTATTLTVTGDRKIRNTLSSYAMYTQGDYKLTDALTATLGLRYTEETKKLKVDRNSGALGPNFSTALIQAAGIPTELNTYFLTPRAALSYQLTPEVMLFTSITRGSKSGGWNGRALDNTLFLPFTPEKVWSEEVGVRADLFNRTLRLNLTGYHSYAKDVQISAGYINNGVRIFTTTNPADLRTYGAELEATWLPVKNLTLNATAGLQHAEYTNVSQQVKLQMSNCTTARAANNAAGIASDCNRGFVDIFGRLGTPVRAPELSANLQASYEILTDKVAITPTIGITYNNGYAIGNAGNKDLTDGSWTNSQFLTDAGIRFEPADNRNISLTVECRNCFTRTYNVSFLSASAIFLDRPGTWDVRLKYRF